MNELKVFECFSSIQGESTYAGRLCFFIRFAGCGLRCSYCDTEKALSPSSFREILTPEELAARAAASGLELVELTGGEPMLQADDVCMLCERLAAMGRFTILMETNGAHDLSVLPPEVVRIVDFKTPSSGMSGRMFIPNFRSLRRADEVKFVIADRADYEFSLAKIKEFELYSQTPNILLGPVSGALDGARLIEWMLADRVRARLNIQLHKCFSGVR